MSDNSKSVTHTIAKIYRDMDAINRAAKQPYQSFIGQMEHAMESLRCQQFGISKALLEMQQATQVKHIISASQHWQDIFKQDTAINRIVESLTSAHQSWFDSIKPIQDSYSKSLQLQAHTKLTLYDATRQLIATERLIAGIDFETIGSRFQIEMPVISGLESSIVSVVASYRSLSESMKEISDITRLPTFILPGATREICTTGLALDTLCLWDEQDEDEVEIRSQLVADAEVKPYNCVPLLRQVDPGLVQPYMGAHEALHGNNTDRERHIFSSLRELWNHLLRQLAPDESVIAWIPENANQKGMLHKGKPTRRAKVLYICRELNKGPLSEFMVRDTQVLVELINLFSKVHKLENELTDEQLRAILIKTDSWLIYILQISLQESNS